MYLEDFPRAAIPGGPAERAETSEVDYSVRQFTTVTCRATVLSRCDMLLTSAHQGVCSLFT